MVFSSKHTPEGFSGNNHSIDDEPEVGNKTYEMYAVAAPENRRPPYKLSPKALSISSLQHLYTLASPENKRMFMEYMLAPAGILNYLDMERTRRAESFDCAELDEFRELFLFDIDASMFQEEMPGDELFEFIVNTERGLLQDFNFVSAYRESGMGIGMIPLTQIEAYIRLMKPEVLQSIGMVEYINAIRHIDSAYVSYHADKQREEMDKNKSTGKGVKPK